ncbi:MAG: DUF5123 domain-containing protein [Paludibacter sp.]|nr:DUF5123 domain-containing protein [Paludibacter sp.]
MKKILIRITYIVCFTAMFFTTACNDVFNQVTELATDRLFRPINFTATLNKTQATLSWVASNNAVSYTLQVSLDSLDYSKPLVDTTLTGLSYVQEFAGATKYYARVRANATDSIKNSKFNAVLSFKTPAENIFDGYGTRNNTGKIYSAYMTAINSLNIKWTPNSKVTHLILLSANGSTRDSVEISSSEAAAGEKNVGTLANSTWKVEIFNAKISRGITSGLVEGDIILNSGDDLPTAMTNASPGQVIILAPGTLYPMGSSVYRFSKNIKLRGLSPSNRPILAMTSGTPTATSNMLGFVDGSSMDYVRFENIEFTGYCDNSTSAVKIGYLFNSNILTTVKSLSFKNCNLHNFANTPMRLQGAKAQVIDTLSFNGCVINEIGFASTYAVVNTNSADYFNNIYFSNCTVYNFKNGFIVRQATSAIPVTMGTVSVTNCTINQGVQDPAAIRYLMDLNLVTITGGVTVKNCIFGFTGSTLGASGIRSTIAIGAINNSGCYYTSDYVDETLVGTAPNTFNYSIKSAMTLYSGASTALWNGPTTGDFTLKDTAFKGKGVAGDLRWY